MTMVAEHQCFTVHGCHEPYPVWDTLLPTFHVHLNGMTEVTDVVDLDTLVGTAYLAGICQQSLAKLCTELLRRRFGQIIREGGMAETTFAVEQGWFIAPADSERTFHTCPIFPLDLYRILLADLRDSGLLFLSDGLLHTADVVPPIFPEHTRYVGCIGVIIVQSVDFSITETDNLLDRIVEEFVPVNRFAVPAQCFDFIPKDIVRHAQG